MKRWLLIEHVKQDIGDTIRQASFKERRLAVIRQLELASQGIDAEIVEFDGFNHLETEDSVCAA